MKELLPHWLYGLARRETLLSHPQLDVKERISDYSPSSCSGRKPQSLSFSSFSSYHIQSIVDPPLCSAFKIHPDSTSSLTSPVDSHSLRPLHPSPKYVLTGLCASLLVPCGFFPIWARVLRLKIRAHWSSARNALSVSWLTRGKADKLTMTFMCLCDQLPLTLPMTPRPIL